MLIGKVWVLLPGLFCYNKDNYVVRKVMKWDKISAVIKGWKMENTILVVDDELFNLRVAQKMFGEEFDVSVASSGEEALLKVKECKPDLILLDVHMPGMDGHLVIQQLKADPQTRDIPVIFITADGNSRNELKGFREGAMDFITKPFRQEIAISRIHRILDIVSLQKMLLTELEKQTKEADQERKKVAEMSKDFLTGLNMRSSGEQKILRAMAEKAGCLAFLDVDNLKKINDTMGHKIGDKLLKTMGEILKKHEDHAIACRLGGDEFLYFMMEVTREEAEQRVNQIISDFLAAKEADASIRQASLSVGLCMCTPEDSYSDVYNKADKALYYVKQNGKAGLFFYQKEEYNLKRKSDVDMEQVMKSLKNSGSYSGAMDVEYREFAKLFEYAANLKLRYDHGFHLIMVTLDSPDDETPYIDEMERAMSCMEDSIQKSIRNLDIYTRYSSVQFLVILFEAGDTNVSLIMDRIFHNYEKEYGNSNILPSFSIGKVDG